MIDRSIRGMLANVTQGLFYKFQFNPSVIKTDKPVHYGILSPAGWDRPIIQYERNGERTMEFDLIGDSTPGSQGQFESARLYGVRDMIAILESFMLPAVDMSDILGNKKKRKFSEPPNCYFVYGLKWAKCKLASAPIRETLFDKTLTPQRFFTTLKLIVMEDGILNDIETAQRVLLSRFGSAQHAFEGGASSMGTMK